jgi:preprotein translocase subunit SecG
MKTAALVLHMFFVLALVGVVLIQRSEGGGLGLGSGNLGGLMTTRSTSNLLTRITAILAAIMFINTIVLALLFKGDAKPKSILDTPVAASAPLSAPISTPDATPVATPAQNSESTPASKEDHSAKSKAAAPANKSDEKPKK